MRAYLEVYSGLGNLYFKVLSDEILKKNGHSEEEIKRIKIYTVGEFLSKKQNDFIFFRKINKVLGGTNKI